MPSDACDPSTREAEMGGSLGLAGQPVCSVGDLRLQGETLAQKIGWRAIEQDT